MRMNGYQRQVSDWLIQRVRSVHRTRDEVLASLSSADDVRRWQERTLGAIRTCFGTMPERTPLKTRVTSVLDAGAYRIESLLFESRPGFLVTANLYVPAKAERAPGILVPCGHSPNGKAWPDYQQLCARLALSGFVALIYDPINQGERDQYHGVDDDAAPAGACEAHNMMAKQLSLVGDFFGSWRAWDGSRALDVLAARPEVDAERLGITGNSGGGTVTTWLWPLDDRLKVAAPSCFTTTFLHNLENELPQDGEQYPPGLLGQGLELADLLAVRAPMPVILLGQDLDFFDQRGFDLAAGDLRRLYGLLGAPDNTAWYRGKGGHGFSPDNQAAAIRFLGKHLGVEIGDIPEPPEPLAESQLYATPDGQVVSAGSRTVQAFIAERVRALGNKRAALAGAALADAVREVLHLPALPSDPPHYRISRAVREHGRIMARYAVETEPGIVSVLRQPHEDGNRTFVLEAPARVTLCLPHLSAEDELGAEPLFTDRLEAGETVMALDGRGRGESMPELVPDEDFFHAYGQEYMHHGICLMLGDSLLGRRVFDVLRVVQLLRTKGTTEVEVVAVGDGCLPAVCAALLEADIRQVCVKGLPTSFADLAVMPVCSVAAAVFPRGVLEHFDLDDVRRELADRLQES